MNDISWAVKVLMEKRHRKHPVWAMWADGMVRGSGGFDTPLVTFTEFEAIAVAEKLERRAAAEPGEPSRAAEVAAAIKQLDELAAQWCGPKD